MIEDERNGKRMAQAITEGRQAGSTGKLVNVVLWVLQIAAALMFLMTGFSKLSGNEQMVGLFEAIGFGQWFRYLTGALEVAGAILLLIPRTSGLGALILVGVMIGAIMTHLFIIGGSPLMAIILLIVTGVIAWGRRQRTMTLLTGLR
jgi:uncharacterized membrane protein YphA (DoxX/SURF4 family)